MAIVITKQPENVRAAQGTAVSFTVKATGVSSYTWQISEDDGASWYGISGYTGVTGADTETVTINPAGAWHAARIYRCLLKDASGNQLPTDVVGITTIAKCVITKYPSDVLASVGDTVTFTVEAENTTYYEWQYSVDGGATWSKISSTGNGSTAAPSYTVSVTVTQSNMPRLYRFELRDSSWAAAYTNTVSVLSEVRRSYAYTGDVQVFVAPVSGIYRLTAVGANGASRISPAYGGRAVGYKEIKKGTTLYVCCGQAGAFDGLPAYNGGGAGIVPTGGTWNTPSGSGGGATHIALEDGTLANTKITNLLIAAGGSGGGSSGPGGAAGLEAYKVPGGSGGGASGGVGGHYGGSGTNAQPGTQESGYGFGRGQSAFVSEIWEKDALSAGAGGGGYYGGYAGNSVGGGGAGGSGYTGGAPGVTYKGVTYSSSMTGDYNSDGTDGYALIELVVKTTIPVVFDGTTLEAIVFNGKEISSLIYNGTKLFCKAWERRIAAWFTSTRMARCLKAST